MPRPILLEMPLRIRHQIAHAFAPMIAGHFVMQIAEAALDGVRTGTIGGQKQQLKTGMLLNREPLARRRDCAAYFRIS